MSMQILNFRPTGDHDWTKWSECAKPGSPGMFPNEQDADGVRYAKDTCAACPVRIECLEEAMRKGESHGVWGGLTPEERSTRRSQAARRARNARTAGAA